MNVPRDPFEEITRRINRALSERDSRIDRLEKAAGQLGQAQQKQGVRVNQDKGIEFVREMQQRGEMYTQIVALLGYGGLLALWSGLASRMPAYLLGITGAMILLSLATFIGWEVWKAWIYGSAPKRDAKAWIEDVERRTASLNRRFYKLQFQISAWLGGGAAAILLVLFFLLPILDVTHYHLIGTMDPSVVKPTR